MFSFQTERSTTQSKRGLVELVEFALLTTQTCQFKNWQSSASTDTVCLSLLSLMTPQLTHALFYIPQLRRTGLLIATETFSDTRLYMCDIIEEKESEKEVC